MSAPPLLLHISIDETAPGWHNVPFLQAPALASFLYDALLLTPHTHLAPVEVSLYCTDDPVMRTLNAQHRNKNCPTNVLSFPTDGIPLPTDGNPLLLGDIILSWSTIVAEAKEQGLTLEEHTMHLLVHGFFHLLGYDHEQEDEAAHMEALERTCLSKRGLFVPL